MAEAPGLEALYQQYKNDGFIVITLLGETNSGATPTQADLEQWANSMGITHPVVADTNFMVTSSFVTGNTIGLPSMDLIGAGGEILYTDSWISEGQISSNLP